MRVRPSLWNLNFFETPAAGSSEICLEFKRFFKKYDLTSAKARAPGPEGTVLSSPVSGVEGRGIRPVSHGRQQTLSSQAPGVQKHLPRGT